MSNEVIDEAEAVEETLRQPIVAVTGHVDHGKTSLLDLLRSIGGNKTNVMNREAGGITQELGVTNVPSELLVKAIQTMPFKEKPKFESPGIIFLDTPGHESFGSIRNRSGSVADIAILIVDIVEGFKPQTIQSIEILEQNDIPFIIVGNKIDRIHQWESKRGRSSWQSWNEQSKDVQKMADDYYFKLLGQVASYSKFNLSKYWDGIKTFDIKNDRLFVPMSAKEGEGLQDLLFVILAMAEKFAREDLIIHAEDMAEGYVLESREEIGVGKTIDIILTKGTIQVGDSVAYNTNDGPIADLSHADDSTSVRIRSIRKPMGMAEMRDAGKRWENVQFASAASGLKLVIPRMKEIHIGSKIFFPKPEEDLELIFKEMKLENKRIRDDAPIMCSICSEVLSRKDFSTLHTNPSAKGDGFSQGCQTAREVREGAVVKARTFGGLEAVLYELKKRKIPISHAEVGPVNKRDVREILATANDEHKFLIALAVKGNEQVEREIKEAEKSNKSVDFNYVQGDIIYQIMDQIDERIEEIREETANSDSGLLFRPAQIRYLNMSFKDKPAVFGVQVLKGQIRVGQELLRSDGTGRILGKILSIGTDGEKIAHEGEQVPIQVNIRFSRSNIVEDEIFYGNVLEEDSKNMRNVSLSESEKDAFMEIIKIHQEILQEFGYGFGWKP
ncbi:MAG: GTP-binding protein [Euryarchaeota archaeon]|jgi:translation initiation factor 5B|nr:GTP-binding protein [Euryarchaeota archaeon]MBT5593934.1 GTP-binding protein [Euryarchaeota archaeon]MBT5843798.1 GTP-binding protein [Euryarchaeota archaeon]MBT6640625.1 GTP-binding protein [Euryarchaeota archaeon]MBT6845083.1 GTP-binding protein [Euryarchaeota archaeon]